MEIGETVKLQYHYGDNETVTGTVSDTFTDLDGWGYLVIDDNNEEWQVYVADLFQGFVTVESANNE